MKQQKIVNIPKIGTWIDGNAFGGFYVDKSYQERNIQEAKDDWKHTIECKSTMMSKMVKNEGDNYVEGQLPCYVKYYMVDNPYYGWKEDQLKIIVEKRNVIDILDAVRMSIAHVL